MSLIIEDGTGVTNANSYVSTTTLTTFATARGVTLTGGAESLLVRAMDYIEGLNYKGLKKGYTQLLQWPRYDVYIDGYYSDPNAIPQQLKDGQCHVAIAIDQGTDLLVDAPRKTSMEKIGDLEVQYSAGSPASVTNVKIQNALWKLLKGGGLVVSKA